MNKNPQRVAARDGSSRVLESDDEIVERIAEQIDERHADEESADALDYLACREGAEFRNANQK